MICFVVVAHKLPAQVERLVDRLAPYRVYLHVDARVAQPVWAEFERLAARAGHVRLLPRLATGWASWALVRAELSGLAAAASEGFSHVVLATGQDYPLRPARVLDSYMAGHPKASWVTCAPMPVPWIADPDGGMSRLTDWHMPVKGRRVRLPLHRRLPAGLEPHYGHANCVLSVELGAWVLEEMGRRPEIERFFRRTWIPDELFFPTMAMASPFAAEVASANLWSTDWSAGGAHPRTFTEADAPALEAAARGQGDGAGAKLFARKFDISVDARVLDLLDEQLLGLGGVRHGVAGG